MPEFWGYHSHAIVTSIGMTAPVRKPVSPTAITRKIGFPIIMLKVRIIPPERFPHIKTCFGFIYLVKYEHINLPRIIPAQNTESEILDIEIKALI